MTPLAPSFYLRSADAVAADLLGKGLYLKKKATEYLVEIVEVEAYLGGEDPASHAFPGPTPP